MDISTLYNFERNIEHDQYKFIFLSSFKLQEEFKKNPNLKEKYDEIIDGNEYYPLSDINISEKLNESQNFKFDISSVLNKSVKSELLNWDEDFKGGINETNIQEFSDKYIKTVELYNFLQDICLLIQSENYHPLNSNHYLDNDRTNIKEIISEHKDFLLSMQNNNERSILSKMYSAIEVDKVIDLIENKKTLKKSFKP